MMSLPDEPAFPRIAECINRMALKSQFPYKIIKVLFSLVIGNNELTILWGS